MSTSLVLVTSSILGAAPVDAPERLISEHGVELRNDERVFVLYAALNALGFAEETRRRGPPLRAPIFHPIRQEVREALRKVKGKDSKADIQRLFETSPAEIETYLEAYLADDGAPLSKEAKSLKPNLRTLDAYRQNAELEGLFDNLAQEQRALSKELKKRIEADFGAAAKLLGQEDLRAPLNLIVIPNPLDGHEIVRQVWIGKERYLLVGPGIETAATAILRASLRSLFQDQLGSAMGGAAKFTKSWSALATSRRIKRAYPDATAYLAEALARAVAYRVHGSKKSREADEEFIEDQTKLGMRWARAGLSIVDMHSAGSSFEKALPRLVAKASP